MDNSIAQALVPYDNDSTMRYSMVLPLAAPREAAAAISAYEALKAAVVRPDDVQKIQGRDFLKKSFWRRIATCFGLTLELVSEQRGFDEGGKLFYSVLYRAIAPNGRSMIGDGYCSTAEAGRGSWPEHNVRATAHTRAKNRAISDLVGGGEVSAEEMPEEEPVTRPTPMKQRYATMPAVRELPAPSPEQESYKHDWNSLHGYALDLGLTEVTWKAARKKYPTIAKMEDALNAYAAQHLELRDGEADHQEEERAAVDEISLQALRLKATKLGYSVAQRDQLFEDCHNDPQEIAGALEYARLNDLQSLGTSAKGLN